MTSKRKSSASPQPSKRKVVISKVPFPFRITDQHVARAIPRDPNSCVIGQALYASPFGSQFQGFVVGAKVTKLISPTTIICYRTPKALADALHTYDKTHLWFLPAGQYQLNPIPPSALVRRARVRNRNTTSKHKTPVRIDLPTRKTFRVGSKQLLVDFPL